MLAKLPISNQNKVSTNMGVSKNNDTPKSLILIGCSIINHPFGGTPIFGNTHIRNLLLCYSDKVGVVSFSPRFRYKIPKIARDVFIISSLDSLLDAFFSARRGPEKCCITGNTGQSEGCGAQHQTLVDLTKEGSAEYHLQGGNVGIRT